MNEPLVTIYITSHNYEDYIAEAIKSALRQTYNNIEIIIFDDNSSDSSLGIIKEFENNNNVTCIFIGRKEKGLMVTFVGVFLMNNSPYSCKNPFFIKPTNKFISMDVNMRI